jgi:hypothetical protein
MFATGQARLRRRLCRSWLPTPSAEYEPGAAHAAGLPVAAPRVVHVIRRLYAIMSNRLALPGRGPRSREGLPREPPLAERGFKLRDAHRVCAEGGRVVVLELDRRTRRRVRWLLGLWFLYWVPFNFETRTRRDLERHTVRGEVEEAGFGSVRKLSKYAGTFQVVEGRV